VIIDVTIVVHIHVDPPWRRQLLSFSSIPFNSGGELEFDFILSIDSLSVAKGSLLQVPGH